MALHLKSVAPMQGARWVREGFVQFARRPLPLTLLFVAFLAAAMLVSVLPYVGGVLQMMALPLLSLGFMVALREAREGRPVRASAYLLPLRCDEVRRRSLLQLCVAYGVVAMLILLTVDLIAGQTLLRLQEALARGDATPQEIDALLAEPELGQAMIAAAVLGSLLSLPFWHAPALVHWGGQRAGQALFSSFLALWRNRSAFLVYGVTWAAALFLFGSLAALAAGLLGARQLAAALALPVGLTFSTVFYASLLATYEDCFGDDTGRQAPPAG